MSSEKFKSDYFSAAYKKGYDKQNPPYKFRSYLEQIMRYAKKGASLLDVGCAYGSFLAAAKDFFELNGCDTSQHAVETARSRIPNANIFQSDITAIPHGKKYDVITCFDVVEHVLLCESALKNLMGLLQDDGILAITVPVYDTLIGKAVLMMDRDETHIHKNSRYWWIEMLNKSGLEVLAWKGIWRYFLAGTFYLHWINKWTRNFSPAIILICRKKRPA